MATKNLEIKLNKLANSVLEHRRHKPEFEKLFHSLHISKDELIKSIINYTTNKGNFENSEYANKLMRLTLHLHNLVHGTYHFQKGKIILDYISRNNAGTLADIGFGTPNRYIFNRALKKQPTTLIDQDKSAEITSRAIFEARSINDSTIDYATHNMNTNGYIGDFNTYVLLDSIEHTLNPTRYLQQLVGNSPKHANFIFTIPIMKNTKKDGKKIHHFHHMEWLTTDDATDWLSDRGLNIIEHDLIIPNPSVDFFAYKDSLTPSYKCLAVNCNKK